MYFISIHGVAQREVANAAQARMYLLLLLLLLLLLSFGSLKLPRS